MSNKRNYGLRGVGLTKPATRRGRRDVKTLLKEHRPGEKKVNRNAPGKEGAINAWACPDCKKLTVVLHQDAGVTPMLLGCRMTEGCEGQAFSLGYPPNPPPRVVAAVRYVWYRPSKKEFDTMSKEMRQHVSAGGLVIAPIKRD